MSHQIKVGALVRFLNAVGGGRVARLTKDTAWVEDEDGFEIPTPVSECIVVDEEDTFMPAYKPPTFAKQATPTETLAPTRHIVEPEPASPVEREIPKPHTFVPATGSVNLYLIIAPEDSRRLGSTSYEILLANDSQYSLLHTIAQREANKWSLLSHGDIDPDSLHSVAMVAPTELNDLEHLSLQFIAYAVNPGVFVGNFGIEYRLDIKKLFKLHSFEANDFVDEPALVIPLVQEGAVSAGRISINTAELGEAMQSPSAPKQASRKHSKTTPSLRPDEVVVTDLHANALLDDLSGMDNKAILEYQLKHFNDIMRQYQGQTGRKLIFIHGKGNGVLRNRILNELKYRYKHCHHQDASFSEYSYGATQITIGNARN